MKKYVCEMCSKTVLRIEEHHIIPWYLSQDDSESNIMKVCRSCHSKADASFDNLILRGKMNVSYDTNKRATARYSKKYRRGKALYSLRLLKNAFYQDVLHYNVKTGNIHIVQQWWYRPYNYIDRRIKSHACLSKAASAKGQTTLTGGC